MSSQRRQKKAAVFFISFFLGVQILLSASPAQAVPVEVVADAPATVFEFKNGILKSLYAAGLSALVNAASYFARKVAYDTAVAVATGGKGQKPLVHMLTSFDYVKSVGDEAAGLAIEELGKPFGLNLCQIPDPRIQVYLQIGLRRIYGQGGPQKPNCNLSDLRKTWSPSNLNKVARERYGSREAVLSRFNADLNVVQSDFSVALDSISNIDRLQAQTQHAAEIERLVGQGFKNLTSPISGNIRTPATAIAEETKLLGPNRQKELSLNQINGVYAAGAAEILPMAGGVFLNTLASQLLDKYLKRGLFPELAKSGSDGSFASRSDGLTNVGGNRNAAEEAFRSLFFASTPTKDLSSYDLISEFAACPDNPGLNNCVIDTDFQKLLSIANTANTSKPLTIREAMESSERYLDPNMPLISPRREFQHNNVRNCYKDGFCYSNIQKLRKARILPLGFEIAALESDPDVPWTLGQVVAGFESDCNKEPKGKFCHLIDPNWIVKAPDARCETSVYGPQREGDSTPFRKRECVDISTCIEGSDGRCLTYGYCTKEKNVWRIPGQSCPAEYATCKTFYTSEQSPVSYLARTLDYGSCTIDSVGCRAYSLEKTGEAWVASVDVNNAIKQSAGRNQAIHFNTNAQSCDQSKDGCTAFNLAERNESTGKFALAENTFVRTSDVIHIKKAPEYLGCYDTNPATPQTDWPVTRADLNRVPNKEQCNAYASACVREEIACDGFKPLDGGPEIPGIIGGNSCPAQCVGYDVFKQAATNFAPAEYPLYFIPKNAIDARGQCSAQDVGCDEFTNLEAANQNGERLEYYTALKYCEKPSGTNEKVYYSWEGSRDQGFVLKTHHLLQVEEAGKTAYISNLGLDYRAGDTAGSVFAVGAPAYAMDTRTALQEAYNTCNKDFYENAVNNRDVPVEQKAGADCRALYDEAGHIYYRLLSQTVTVSNDCKRVRKTESRLEADPDLTAQGESACTDKGGFWNNNSCQRCYNGGRYNNGACVYQTIPSEAKQCAPAANGCRLYVGNTGNNIQEVFYDDFEPKNNTNNAPVALNAFEFGWQVSSAAGERVISPEALQVQQYALRATGNNHYRADKQLKPGDLKKGAWYELHFWARGSGQRLRVALFEERNDASISEFTKDIATGNETLISLGSEWREYTLGPVQFNGNPDSDKNILTFFRVDGGSLPFFLLDKVRLTKIADSEAQGTVGRMYLIKDSWKKQNGGNNVPVACDATQGQNDDGLPGEMLGCRAYTNRDGQTKYATGFESLCREQAIGCQPLWDTQNTLTGEDNKQAKAFNVWGPRTLPSGQAGTSTVRTVQGTLYPENKQCNYGATDAGCFISALTLPAGETLRPENIVASTIIIPEDTPDAAPLFLTVTPQSRCSESERGCRKVGLEEQTLPDDATYAFAHSETGVLNDPDAYATQGQTRGILCRDDLVGCGEYTSGNTTYYFRDPKTTGSKFCEYKQAQDGSSRYGWFKKDVGQCSNDTDKLCRSNTDCGSGNSCTNIGYVECSPQNIARGGEQGIWSNESSQYDGFVGLCPEQFNACTELVDTNDKSADYPRGKEYYAIYDDRLTSGVAECDGKVSLKEGCVLFDKADNPNKLYDTAATYRASALVQDGFVGAIGGTNDSNVILKVDRDRACSEWLACKSSIPHIDEKGNRVNLCYEFKSCIATTPGIGCTDWADATVQDSPLKERLTKDIYINRNTSWSGFDYSGYSLYNKYQIDKYIYLSFDLTGFADLQNKFGNTSYVAYKADDRYFEGQDSSFGCVESNNNVKHDWEQCGVDLGGRCYKGHCVYPVDGAFDEVIGNDKPTIENLDKALGKLTGGNCKAYPEQDSPYARALVQMTSDNNDGLRILSNQPNDATAPYRVEFQQVNPQYSGANACQEGNCSCEYSKVVYKDGKVDYWPLRLESARVSNGICNGGRYDGYPCVAGLSLTNDTCARSSGGGICMAIDKKETHIGTQGYCLEYDLSRPLNKSNTAFACLTWLPIDVSVSGADVYNADIAAGYNPDEDSNGFGQVYCANATNGGAVDRNIFAQSKTADGEFNKYFFTRGGKIVPYISGAGCTIGVEPTVNDIQEGQTYYSNDQCMIHYDNDFKYCGVNFQVAACASNSIRLYSAMQSWAWKSIGNNAVILRTETGENNGDSTGFEDINGLQKHYHLVPVPEVSADSGVLLHAPRNWGSGNGAPVYFDYPYDFVLDSSGAKETRTLSTVYLSAGYNFDVRGNSDPNKYLYQSTYENSVKEGSLDKIYFVPTLYPKGGEGATPQILSKELFIDFTYLRDLLDSDAEAFKVSRVEKAFLLGTGDGQNGNEGPVISRPADSTSEFGNNRRVVDAGLWTYAMQRDKVGGDLLKYWNYPKDHTDIATIDDRRNEIYRRYVLVFGGKKDGQLPGFMLNNTVPISADSDPFLTTCLNRESENWLAIGADFNREGEFLGYISRWCNATDNNQGDNGINFTVIATQPEQCTEFAQVYDGSNPLSGQSNKAWTDRVWKNAAEVWKTMPNQAWGRALIERNDQLTPYGSLRLTSSDIPTNAAGMANLDKYFFRSKENYGVPFACFQTWNNGLLLNPLCGSLKNYGYSTELSSQPLANGVGNILGSSRALIHNLFAKYFNLVSLRPSGVENLNTFSRIASQVELDQSETIALSALRPPKIYSINPFNCLNSTLTSSGSRAVKCTPGEENNITVSGRNGTLLDYNGDSRPDEDLNVNGLPDSLISRGSFTAITQFFAFADDNRMPIRRVKIDWTDGSIPVNENKFGLYKNRKPFCENTNDFNNLNKYEGDLGLCVDANDKPTGLTCKQEGDCAHGEVCKAHSTPTNTDLADLQTVRSARTDEYSRARFGDLPRACTPNYFEFTHTYTCGTYELAQKDFRGNKIIAVQVEQLDADSRDRVRAQGFAETDEVCVFRPKVQVLDNWGWCNGTAQNGSSIGVFNDGFNVGGRNNYCDLPDYNIDPWTVYKGKIIVLPVRRSR